MREQIQSEPFVAQITEDVDALKAAKEAAHNKKKEARQHLKEEETPHTKDERKEMKRAFIRAKINHEAAKAAYNTAHKMAEPFLEMPKTKKNKKEKTTDETSETEKMVHPDKNGKAKISRKTKGSAASDLVKKQKTSLKTEKSKKSAETKQKKTKVKGESTTDRTKKVPKTIAVKKDDLTLIEGIGPKIADVLQHEGIYTFSDLAKTSVDGLRGLLKEKQLQFANPETWAEQAQLAAEGKMIELEDLKAVLKHGQRL